jgi:hypothetical protein
MPLSRTSSAAIPHAYVRDQTTQTSAVTSASLVIRSWGSTPISTQNTTGRCPTKLTAVPGSTHVDVTHGSITSELYGLGTVDCLWPSILNSTIPSIIPPLQAHCSIDNPGVFQQTVYTDQLPSPDFTTAYSIGLSQSGVKSQLMIVPGAYDIFDFDTSMMRVFERLIPSVGPFIRSIRISSGAFNQNPTAQVYHPTHPSCFVSRAQISR